VLALAFTALVSFCRATIAAESPKPPNIVLVMTDDQGCGDLSFTGNPNPLQDTPSDR